MTRRPGLSKSNERKLTIARKLLAEIALATPDAAHLAGFSEKVDRGAYQLTLAAQEFDRLLNDRAYGVQFYKGKLGGDLLAAYATHGHLLTVDEVVARAEEYRVGHHKDTLAFGVADLNDAILEVVEIVPGQKSRRVFPKKPLVVYAGGVA